MLKPSVTDDQPAEPKTIPQFRDVIAGMTKSVFMKINPAATQLAATLCIFASLVWVLGASGQSTRRPTISAYINPGAVAAPARSFLFAFGDRIQRPGKERATLMGKYTDRSGAVDFRLVWEVPGRLRFDRSDKPGRPIIYDEVIGWNNAAAIAPDEAGALESLFDDSPESFFYGMVQGAGHRFLGNRFRADHGKTANYKGPWYDLYQVVAPVRSPQGISRRQKVYFFDSQSGLLSRVDYQAAGSVRISTEMSGWSTLNGQAFPGSVVRKENGVVVLTVNFTSVSVGPTASDGIFPGH